MFFEIQIPSNPKCLEPNIYWINEEVSGKPQPK